jgi:DNA-binding transcriptional LysR family regulator
MDNWDDIRIFLAAAKARSLSRAARGLAMSQPTVSRRISALEKRLGSALFLRVPGGLQLTEAGEALLGHAERMEAEHVELARDMSGQATGLEGAVRVSFTELIGLDWLARHGGEFCRRFPGIRLEMGVEARAVDLLRREADIAVRLGKPGQADLVVRKLHSYEVWAAASEAYIERRGKPKRFGELARHDLVFYDESQWVPDVVREFSRRMPAECFKLRSNSGLVQLAAVEAGMGIGLNLDRFIAERPGLIRVLEDITILSLDLWLVTHPDLRRSPRIRAVLDFLAESLAAG